MSVRPRVLMVIDTLEVGGAERSLLELARHLRSFEALVAPVFHDGALAVTDPGADGGGGNRNDEGVRILRRDTEVETGWLAGWRRLETLVREIRPHLVHSTLFRTGLLARTVCRLRHVPLVHTLVNEPISWPSRPGRRLPRRLLQEIDRRTARWVGRFVANSRAVARSQAAALRLPLEEIEVIYRGRDPGRYRPRPEQRQSVRRELGIPSAAPLLLNVGRLRPPKGQRDAVRALPEILRQLPRTRLVLVGDGPERSALESLGRELGIEDRMILLGTRDDVPRLLAAADVFVFPSHAEGHPGALIEALMTGLPVVASDIDPHRETLSERVGHLVPVGDPDALARAVCDLLTHPDRARALGETALSRARERFGAGIMAARYEDVYRGLLAERPSEHRP